LRSAAISGDLNGIKEWARGYSINARGGYGEPTILIDAVKANAPIEAIKLIIQLGAFINSVDDKHRTALHHACEIGSFDVVKLLLKKGAQYFLRDSLGRTAFHIVAAHSSAKCLALVLQHTKGCEEINDGDNEGMTPLHWTVAKNHTEHLDIMLSKKYRLDLGRTDIEG
jgi:ankyrin repeat protein